MKKKKRGFTLVELLAVIVILAVILVIAVPRIMSVIKDAKLGSIESTAKIIASTAESRYESKKALGLDVGDLKCTDVASLSNDYGTCKITFDDNGVATVIVNGKKDGKFNNLSCQGTKDNMTCAEGEISTARKCTTTNTLTNGLNFVDGQYTYTYWSYNKGWSVSLASETSTKPVTTELCGTINDIPIVDMSYMFAYSAVTNLDLSSFDTSKVTKMKGMFSESAATEIKGLENFDTSNVTNMGNMFVSTKVTSLDLSGFDTSKITNMAGMFEGTKVTSLDLSNFNTSNVTNMNSMFAYSAPTSLDVSSFNTSNVTDMSRMFAGSVTNQIAATEIKGLENFNTSKVTNMSYMFSQSKVTTLDLSSFDTSNVTNMNSMFAYSAATTGYARTQSDADRFNASSNKPSGLTFVVKS